MARQIDIFRRRAPGSLGETTRGRDGSTQTETGQQYAPERKFGQGISQDREEWLARRATVRRLAGHRRGAAKAYWRLAWLRRDPSTAVRASVLWLGGERGMVAAGRLLGRRNPPEHTQPPWLRRALHPPPAKLRAIWR
jgi:hypothetical protein